MSSAGKTEGFANVKNIILTLAVLLCFFSCQTNALSCGAQFNDSFEGHRHLLFEKEKQQTTEQHSQSLDLHTGLTHVFLSITILM